MALEPFLTAEEHGKLPDVLKGEYKPNEELKDGNLYLIVKPRNGWALENVAGLKEVVSERTEKHRQATKQLDAWKTAVGDATPEQAKAALEQIGKLGDLSDKEKIEKRISSEREQITAKYDQQLATEKAKNSVLMREVERVLVESELARVCAKPEIRGSYELLIGPIRSRTKVTRSDDGKFHAQVLDRNGNPAISQKPGNNGAMDLEELVVGLRSDATYQRAFEGTGSTGSGASGSGSSGNNGTTTKVDPKLPPEERLKQLRAQGATAK